MAARGVAVEADARRAERTAVVRSKAELMIEIGGSMSIGVVVG